MFCGGTTDLFIYFLLVKDKQTSKIDYGTNGSVLWFIMVFIMFCW